MKKLTKKQIKKIQKREDNALWKKLKQQALERDEGCIICKRTDLIHTHHLIPREIKDFKFDIDNLVSLCPLHHKFDLKISPHRNPFEFYRWFLLNKKEQYFRLLDKWMDFKSIQ